MPTSSPLLTIAIPTYNRSADLAQLLGILLPQLEGRPEIELLISDNASTDDTSAVVQRLIPQSHAVRCHRHPENIGSDANFVSCFNMARGRYFWLCGDDDIILPGAIEELLSHITTGDFDIIYATSYGFRENYLTERQGDPLHRRFHTITSPLHLARVVNIMFTFISGIIVNKERLEAIPHEDPAAFLDTNLVQLSWSLPLLRDHRRSLVLWNRQLAGRQGNAGGYALARVFGEQLISVTNRLLPDRPEIAKFITNFTIRRWFPSIIYDVRSSDNQRLQIDQAHSVLRQTYGRNFRYWLFTYPVLKLPLPLAHLWLKTGAVISKSIYAISVPGFWRAET
jgi:glycosyltransferase involved in cell wall biosynthesis